MSHTAPNKVPSDRIERCLEIDKINEKRNVKLKTVMNNSSERINLINT